MKLKYVKSIMLCLIVIISYITSIVVFANEKPNIIEDTVVLVDDNTKTKEIFLKKTVNEETISLYTLDELLINKTIENENDREELIIVLSKMLFGEARDCSQTEQAAVIWCALNIAESRYENPTYRDIINSTIKKGTFYGYNPNNSLRDDHLYIVEDVLNRWELERTNPDIDVGRVLPKDYLFFSGDGTHNYFRNAYKGDYDIWDWSLESPYDGPINIFFCGPECFS